MFTVTDAQIEAWLGLLLWPFFRILAMLSIDPFFSSRTIPGRVRIMLAMLLALLIAPLLPPMPPISPVSPLGILIIIQQVIIGVALGFVMRVIFASIEMAGHLAGLQMGLGFASFYDPQHGSNSIVVAQFVSMLTMLLFLAMSGHLVVLEALVKSFVWLPISDAPLKAAGFKMLAEMGGQLFTLGLMLSMPVVVALLMTNLCIGVMSRAAPQFNVFAVGFPITMSIGAAAMYLSLPAFIPHIQSLIARGAQLSETIARAMK